jgi:hypothetical protein
MIAVALTLLSIDKGDILARGELLLLSRLEAVPQELDLGITAMLLDHDERAFKVRFLRP